MFKSRARFIAARIAERSAPFPRWKKLAGWLSRLVAGLEVEEHCAGLLFVKFGIFLFRIILYRIIPYYTEFNTI